MTKSKEAVTGVLVGFPIGFALYYVPVMVLAEVIAASSNIRLIRLLDWNSTIIAGLVLVAAVTEWGLFRQWGRRGRYVFFWGQAASSLFVCVPLLVSTAVHHNPVLPFYGQ